MKIEKRSLLCVLTLAATLFCSQPVYASSMLSLLSSGNGGFVLQGAGMEKVASLDITINYDTSTLSNPRVTSGGLALNAMMEVNPNVPGIVRIGIITISPIQGAGTIATLAFDRVGDSPGRINTIKASITNSKGQPLPVIVQFVNPPDETGSASATPPNKATQSGVVVYPPAATPDGGGQILIPGGNVPSNDAVPASQKEPVPPPEAMVEPAKDKIVASHETVSYATGTVQSNPPAVQNKKIALQKSVLERFREYKGEQSAKAFTALFNQEPLNSFRQDPAIVLSDGISTAKITFIAMPVLRKTPDVKATGATLLSLKKDPDNTNTWIAELRPDKKTISATLVVSLEKADMEFPIVVAPEASVDLDKSGVVTEADFKMYLLDRGTLKAPRFDLNNDGKRDFVDDYIFTANYLIQTERAAKKQPDKKLK